ncbi:MAG: hypothetical protein AAFX54_16150 [Pseudomonadota bacterium]
MKFSAILGVAAAGLLLAACGGSKTAENDGAPQEEAAALSNEARLDAILAGDHRTPQERARDAHRHPKETLLFFGIEPDMTVVEIWPGGGWYTQVIAPYLKTGGGKYYAAGFSREGANERILASLKAYEDFYAGNPELYGEVDLSALSGPIAPDGPVDAILTFRNLHNWGQAGTAATYMAAFYDALKPGGVLGVVQHRADGSDAPRNGAYGYLYTDDVIELAQSVGFVFEEASEVNANIADTKDHPFGVWTLPPVSRSANVQGMQAPGFDPARYAAIGESDRMTLRFRKPVNDTASE